MSTIRSILAFAALFPIVVVAGYVAVCTGTIATIALVLLHRWTRRKKAAETARRFGLPADWVEQLERFVNVR